MSTKEKYKALISALLNAWGGKATVKSAKSIEINGTAHNPAAVVVKTWMANDGLSWYRKYSDGWIEQGGYASWNTYSGFVVMPTAFSSTNYVIQLSVNNYTNTDPCIINVSPAHGKETSKFGVSFKNNIGKGYPNSFYWFACGY